MAKLKWVEATIREAAARHPSRAAFADAHNAAAMAARSKYPGLLDELFPKQPINGGRFKVKWTEATIREAAANFTSRAEFDAGSGKAAEVARAKYPGLLDELFPKSGVPFNLKWTEATIREAAAKYPSRSSFESNNPAAVSAAQKRHPGLLDALFPRKIREAWTETEIREEAKKYTSISDFQKNSTAEPAARKMGILDDLGFTRPTNWRFKWTEAAIRAEAAKYQTKGEFEKFARGASERARLTGIIDKLGLLEYPPSDNDTIYIWRALGQYFNGDPVYKIGVTSSRLGHDRINQVAKGSGFEFELVCSEKVAGKASMIETKLLCLGANPQYTGFNGASEFRSLSPSALDAAIQIIQLALDKLKI